MFRKLMLVTIAATGLALVGLPDTASADHGHRRSRHHHHHHGFYDYGGSYCPSYGFDRSPYYGGYRGGFYRQPAFSGYRHYGYGGTGLFIQGRNFGFGLSRW
jgi:hypothetical protein